MVAVVLASQAMASPTAAERLRRSWELQVAKWNLDFKNAMTPAEKAKLVAEVPDANAELEKMWQLIGAQLANDWAIEPAAWFLKTAHTWDQGGGLAKKYGKQMETVRKAVEAHHLRSPKVLPMCVALTSSPDPLSLALLEKISKANPDEKIQGAASLGCAMLLGQLGDDPGIMRRRLSHLRKAIIQSVDVDFGGKKVGELAQDETYVITFLSKGRVAPDLTGVDSAGRSIRLSDFRGKVIYLLFWNSMMPEPERVLKMVNEAKQSFVGKPFEVIGVSSDSLMELRKAVGAKGGTVTWRNFTDATGALSNQYRVRTHPMVFVLDQQRKIQFSGMPGSFADLTCEALLEN